MCLSNRNLKNWSDTYPFLGVSPCTCPEFPLRLGSFLFDILGKRAEACWCFMHAGNVRLEVENWKRIKAEHLLLDVAAETAAALQWLRCDKNEALWNPLGPRDFQRDLPFWWAYRNTSNQPHPTPPPPKTATLTHTQNHFYTHSLLCLPTFLGQI